MNKKTRFTPKKTARFFAAFLRLAEAQGWGTAFWIPMKNMPGMRQSKMHPKHVRKKNSSGIFSVRNVLEIGVKKKHPLICLQTALEKNLGDVVRPKIHQNNVARDALSEVRPNKFLAR